MQIFLIILIIIFSLAAIIIFLLFSWIKLQVKYNAADGLNICAKAFIFKYNIINNKNKKIKLRDYKIKRFKKLEEKKLNKIKKNKKQKEPETQISEELPLLEKISRINLLLNKIFKKFANYLYIDLSKLYIKVASDEAAKTAYLYSAAVQSVAYITQMFENIFNFNLKNNLIFKVEADFSAEEPEFEADFVFKIKLINILKLGFMALGFYTKTKNLKT